MQFKKVPCQIEDGKFCVMPFCRFMFFAQLSEEARREWINQIKKELEEYGKNKR
jgi:tripartite-type tricarboxylate transporter receptor subunit TctC